MFDSNYLQQLIADGIEEGPELEYKAAAALQREDKKVAEISKDVSAFANSNGGILIYGISENQVNKHLPGHVDPIDRKVISKEWLEQILNAKIRPRIHGLTIHVITIAENQVVYLLEIPKGDTAHQAEDKRYYRRHNFMVEPLFDHEIRDIMGRQKDPVIEIEFELIWRQGTGRLDVPGDVNSSFVLNVYAHNIGKIYAKYVNVSLMLPQKCMNINQYVRNDQNSNEIKLDNKIRDLVTPDAGRFYLGQIAKPPEYGPARHEPVLPGMRMLLKSMQVNQYATDAGNEITWIVYADNASPKTGGLQISEIGRV